MQIKENTLAIAIFSLVMFVIGCIALTISITNNTEKLTEYDYSPSVIEEWLQKDTNN